MKKTIAIALSGGIDSLVSASLLKEQGHSVFGIHFVTGHEKTGVSPDDASSDRINIFSDQLGIPLEIIHIRDQFEKKVIRYFANAYMNGRTPNPCLVCNPQIKFGMILAHAKKRGASHLATGHYAKVKRLDNGRYGLFKGSDMKKDQSYFLSRLTQDQLGRAVFPLGGMTKDQTIALAKNKRLKPAFKSESQDICFIRESTYGEFIKNFSGFTPKNGPITDVKGHILGEHKGLHLYTIGQRRGINIPAERPYYVLNINIKTNSLVVGFKEETFSSCFKATEINWINPPPWTPGNASIEAEVRIRYRHQQTPSTITPGGGHDAVIRFKTPQSAVTPGQGAVFYKNDQVLGGGWISTSENDLK